MPELATARQHGLPIIVVVVSNNGYATIRRLQTARYGRERVIAADLLNPDFVALAHAFDCFGQRVDTPAQFAPALRAALASGQPAIIDVAFPVEGAPADYGLAGAQK